MSTFTLETLEAIVTARANAAPEESYTAKLKAQGMPRAAKKLGEEAVEAVIAATSGDRDELVKESADILYHLLVVLHMSGVRVQDVMQELARRTGQSGLEEKAARPKD
jgi:phosphoribosyl-ATP pyrophosphohydrolase